MILPLVRKYSTGYIPRWFRAVDVPDTKPGIYEYKPSKKPWQFEAFSVSDSRRLEQAYQNKSDYAFVEADGLLTVDIKKKLCRPTFWDGPGFSVRRSLWFETMSNFKIVPVDPELEKKIEDCYQTRRHEKVEIQWPTKDGNVDVYGHFTTGGKPSEGGDAESSAQPMLVLKNKDSWLPTLSKRQIYRGIPNVISWNGRKNTPVIKIRPEYKKRDIKHLVFCVHGIGQLLSVKFEQINFVNDVDGLRRAMGTSFSKLNTATAKLGGDSGVQVLPVLWRHKLSDSINGLKPNQLFGTTNLAADAILDFVMYTDMTQRKLIQEAAASEMNRMYKLFCEAHPEFKENPRVSIIGHSLGSVIAYDLINPEAALADLEFQVTNLFTLGSPIGVIDLIRQAPTVVRGRAQALYNIMRLADPVAARLEPLVSRDCLKIAPKPLPGGGTNVLQQVKELTGDLASQGEILTNKATSLFQFLLTRENEPVPNQPSSHQDVANTSHLDLQSLKHFNRHGRLDFSVQESMDLSLLLGLAGHLMYLDNPDVVQFILKELLEL